MSEQLLVGLLTNRGVWLHTVKDLSPNNLSGWERKHGDYLLVAVHPVRPELWFAATGISLRPPKLLNLLEAAVLLQHLPVDRRWLPTVAQRVRKLGSRAGPLLNEWAAACRAARKEVAALCAAE